MIVTEALSSPAAKVSRNPVVSRKGTGKKAIAIPQTNPANPTLTGNPKRNQRRLNLIEAIIP
jgi:hypothetical protein